MGEAEPLVSSIRKREKRRLGERFVCNRLISESWRCCFGLAKEFPVVRGIVESLERTKNSMRYPTEQHEAYSRFDIAVVKPFVRFRHGNGGQIIVLRYYFCTMGQTGLSTLAIA